MPAWKLKLKWIAWAPSAPGAWLELGCETLPHSWWVTSEPSAEPLHTRAGTGRQSSAPLYHWWSPLAKYDRIPPAAQRDTSSQTGISPSWRLQNPTESRRWIVRPKLSIFCSFRTPLAASNTWAETLTQSSANLAHFITSAKNEMVSFLGWIPVA